MITAESMGRRICKDGDEVDYLTGDHRYIVINHGQRAKIKANRNRRVRREVRQGLRNSQEG